MIAEGTPSVPKVTVLDESAEEARARKSRFEQAKRMHGPSAPTPVLRVPSAPRAYPPTSDDSRRPSRGSLVLRAAGVDEQLLSNRVDRVRFYSLGAALLINGVLTGLLASYALAMLLPPVPGVIVGLVGALCGLLNFFIDRSLVNTVLVRHLERRHDRVTLALSLTGRILLAALAAVPTAYVLTFQVLALQVRRLADSLPASSAEALRVTAELQRDVWNPHALQVLFTGILLALQLLPTIMAASARTSRYARRLRADDSDSDASIATAAERRRPGRGSGPQHRRSTR